MPNAVRKKYLSPVLEKWLCPMLPLLFSPALVAQNYALKPTINPGTVYAGYSLTMRIDAAFTGKPDHIYLTSLAASSPGIAVKPYCNWANPDCWKIGGKLGVWNEHPSTSFDLKVTPSARTKPGSYSVRITTTSLGVQRSLTLPVRVVAVPPPPAPAALPKKVPKLPGLTAWRDEMIDTGDRFCDPKARYGFGNERDVWYYDGAYVYFQVYAYTRKPKWKACALNIASQFRDYVLSAQPPGGIPGWRVFTQGLRLAYRETHDPSYRQAVQALVEHSAFVKSDGDPDDQAIRETSYLLRAYTDAHLLGIAVAPAQARRAADYLIGMADTLFAGPPQTTSPMIHQDFFDGILAEALTYYYDNWVRDPRIPPTIGKLCNWMYTWLWDAKRHAMIYNPFPRNPGYPRHCVDMCQEEERTLLNLIAPAYFWYWRLTGDDSVRRKGDEIFAHALDDPINDKGKSYSENYHWSFAGVKWRTEM